MSTGTLPHACANDRQKALKRDGLSPLSEASAMSTDRDGPDTDAPEAARADVPMLATRTIAELERSATILCVDEPESELHHWINLADVLVARAKQIRQMVERVAIEWITANGPTRM